MKSPESCAFATATSSRWCRTAAIPATAAAPPRMKSGSQVVLSLQRLNRVRQVDAANYSMIVEAGCTLAEAQRGAGGESPLSIEPWAPKARRRSAAISPPMPAEPRCLRYGMMRDLVLGLEVVLADGSVLVGAEKPAQGQHRLRREIPVHRRRRHARHHHRGLVSSCFRIPADTATALVGIDSPHDALDLLARLRTAARRSSDLLRIDAAHRRRNDREARCRSRESLDFECPWYLLIELSSPNPKQDLTTLLTAELEDAADGGAVKDAMLATSLGASAGDVEIARDRCRRRSAVTAPASSTMSRCRSPPSPRSSRKAARWRAASPPKATWSPTATRATAICISI